MWHKLIRPGSVPRQVPNFGFVLVNVRFTLSFFCVFLFKRVFITALGPNVKWQLKNIQDRNDYHMTRTNLIKYKERQAILQRARFSDQEIIMETQFRMCTPPWIRPGSVLRQVPNFGFVLVNVRFTLSIFCVFVVFHPRYNPDVKPLVLKFTAVLWSDNWKIYRTEMIIIWQEQIWSNTRKDKQFCNEPWVCLS
jgi:hypothetical protein